MLDIACGTGAHLEQLGLRGYEVDGFDISPKMVEFAKEKVDAQKLNSHIWIDNMVAFACNRKYGAAINLLTGFNYLLRNEDALAHLDHVADVLESGGIYILELNHPRDFITNRPSTTNVWIESRGQIEIEVDWDRERTDVDVLTQQVESSPHIVVKDGEKILSIDMCDKYRIYLYQEMRLLIQCNGRFELVDSRGSFKLDNPLDNSRDSWRMVLVLRRK
ncbi:MAG: class I SAM-dependent methyltransferase [Acidobacteria bacterium]|nr:class I SAM-dependent methyltransferase [Acidobacteriota bacterium]